ncbi:hypothetical protein MCEMRE130_00217 [Candidatus Nanopelagicaceae bacterium]
MIKRPTFTQIVFYSLVFISGFLYQPNWVYDNFWDKADFYDSIPFDVPFSIFLLIYSFVLTTLVWGFVRFAKIKL